MPTIERYKGQPIPGVGHAGGGYSGATEKLDLIVQQAATALAEAFNLDIRIRFNSDQRGGGAWLKDARKGFAAFGGVGLTARIKPDHSIQIATYIAEDSLVPDAITNRGNPDTRYAFQEHANLEAGLAFLRKYAIT